ncbi:hypothetical protein Tco_0354277, partial [Tanacetum coccineum]
VDDNQTSGRSSSKHSIFAVDQTNSDPQEWVSVLHGKLVQFMKNMTSSLDILLALGARDDTQPRIAPTITSISMNHQHFISIRNLNNLLVTHDHCMIF